MLEMTFFYQLKSNTKGQIKMKKMAGKCCSITLVEYKSTRNRRYIYLNLHCGEEHIKEKYTLQISVFTLYCTKLANA